MTKQYDASSIQVLDDMAHIRLRPGVYVGGANEVGLYTILKEILDNAFDEALAGHAKTITLTMDDDCRGATIDDDGRGIPLDKHPKTKISTLATVYGMAKSGAKFDSEAYGTSVGLNGVGSTATNALSELFEATSYRGKQCGAVLFKRGRLFGKDAVITKLTQKSHGTSVHFRPDFEEIFKDVEPYDANRLKSSMEDTALLLPKVKLQFRANPAAPYEVFDNSAGIGGLLNKYAASVLTLEPLIDSIEFEVAGQDGSAKAEAEIALGWRDAEESPSWHSYINLSKNPEGGTHQAGFEKAVVGYLIERARGKCTAREILDGLVGIIHLKHPAPQFSSQTKEKLINKELTKQLQEALEPALRKWARRNSEAVDKWLAVCIERFNQREEQRNLKSAMKDLKLTKRSSKGILPAKLYEANCRPEERELFLVEGDSAKGSVVKARDASYQEVLPLKGKILNVLRAPLAASLENTEIASIIAAVGGGVGDSFDLSKCRVRGKLILLADGDVDGLHISTLVLTLLCTLMRPMVEAGLVYTVDAPLFVAALPGTKTRYYAHTLDELKKRAGKDFARCDITRLKGHGEANHEAVAEYAMDPATRRLISIRFTEADFQQLDLLMSDDVGERRELLGL